MNLLSANFSDLDSTLIYYSLASVKLPKSSLTYSLPQQLVQVANIHKGR